MAHLYPHMRIHQVFGANTDVGKTIFTTALCIASAALPCEASTHTAADNIPLRAHPHAENVHYLKPVSTGALADSDDGHLATFAPHTSRRTLYRFPDPVSPHQAVRLSSPASITKREERGMPPSPTDSDYVRDVGQWLQQCAEHEAAATAMRRAVAYIETAGGVHSPGPSGTSQSALLRPLRLPTILVGSSELGGISTTISAYESLMLAGYDVEAVLLFPSPYYGNGEYLKRWFEEHGIRCWSLGGPQLDGLSQDGHWGPPPARAGNKDEDIRRMRSYYSGLVRGRSTESPSDEEDVGGVFDVVRHLRDAHATRIKRLEGLAGRTRETCWWPFTQHGLVKSDKDVTVIDSAYGDFFSAFRSHGSKSITASDSSNSLSSKLHPLLDGSASWWTQTLGHAHPRLVRAAARAAARYGHVLFPLAANEPAVRLAERLTGRGLSSGIKAPGTGWAARAFFSDDGSTGMEVALKMAIQSSVARYSYAPKSAQPATGNRKGGEKGGMGGRASREWEVLGIKGSYHGDTIGAMDACEGGVYNAAVQWYRGRGHWMEPPVVTIEAGRPTVSAPRASIWDAASAELMEASQARPSSTKAFSVNYETLSSIYDVESRLSSDPLAHVYRKHVRAELEHLVYMEGRRFGALVIEPLVLGAAGMVFIDPLFQRCLVDVVRESADLFSASDPPLRGPTIPGVQSNRRAKDRDPSEWQGLPVIYDEVFTGLYRLGVLSPASVIGATPDISVLAKVLTGGMVPMSVTLASASIFNTFSNSERKVDALLHGHSYTAYPIACEIASETLAALEEMESSGQWDDAKKDWSSAAASSCAPNGSRSREVNLPPQSRVAVTDGHDAELQQNMSSPRIWSFWSKESVHALSCCSGVDSAMALGTVLAVQLRDEENGGYQSTAATSLLRHLRNSQPFEQNHPSLPEDARVPEQLAFNVHARPLGNVVYVMCSFNTPRSVCAQVEQALLRALDQCQN